MYNNLYHVDQHLSLYDHLPKIIITVDAPQIILALNDISYAYMHATCICLMNFYGY